MAIWLRVIASGALRRAPVVSALWHYPCVKRAWVEYLGEHPEPALDRVE